MAPDTNFRSMSHNHFIVNDIFFNSESDRDINFHINISPLDTKYFNPSEVCESFERLCKSGYSVLHVYIRSINKNFEKFKNFYHKLDCTFNVIFVFQKQGLLVIRFVMIRIIVLHQVREYGSGGGFNIFVHKEVYFKPRTNLSINSNGV